MIQGISIENFRGFHKTTIKGFDRINLFGGKNNVGKTSFLEAIYVGLTGDAVPIIQTRNGSSNDGYVFFNQNTEVKNEIQVFSKEEGDFSSQISKNLTVLKNEINVGQVQEKKFYAQVLGVPYQPMFWSNNKASLIIDKNIQHPKQYNLSTEFDKADKKGESDEMLKAVQVIEPQIVEIKTYSDHPGMIYLRKQGEKQRIPLIYYGDAIQKVMRYIITIAAFQNENGSNGSDTEGGKYLLIDEIENGLHYTVQEEFWKMLFKLAIAYDIQIFAATHSREMIAAFDKTALEFENEAAYFELYRHVKTNEIAANKIRPEVLEYKLENDKPMRGE